MKPAQMPRLAFTQAVSPDLRGDSHEKIQRGDSREKVQRGEEGPGRYSAVRRDLGHIRFAKCRRYFAGGTTAASRIDTASSIRR